MKQVQSNPAPWMLRVSACAICIVLAAGSMGCLALMVGAAGGAAGAVYVMGKLTEEVRYDVPTVHQAAKSALQDLELTPTEDRADKLSAHMESKFADDTRVWIDMDSLEDSRTKMTIRVGLTGDEGRSRKILDKIKAHLPAAVPPTQS